MKSRSRLGLLPAISLTGLLFWAAAPVGAQPMAIEHKDVSCLVAGQFPVLDACFRPGPGLARARVYFRPEGTANWYYVEAKPAPPNVNEPADLACRQATLPKPKKALVKKHVEYYVDATGKGLESSQSQTFKPVVVVSQGECKGKLVAAFLPSALVQVFPSVPAAFAVGGGLSGIATAAVVGAGVAATTGAVAVVKADDSPAPATTQPSVVTTQPSQGGPAPPTTAPTTTLPPPAAFNPVFKVFRNGVLETGSTVSGTEPVQLRFVMCESAGPRLLRYNVLVNGTIVTAGCDSTITFTDGGFTPGFGAVVSSRGTVRTSAAAFSVVMQVQSDAPNNDPKASRELTVQANTVPTTTTTSTTTIPTTTTTSTTTLPTTSTTTSTSTTTTSTTTSTTSSTTTSSTTTTTMLPCFQPSLFLTQPENGQGFIGGDTIPFRVNATVAPGSEAQTTVTYQISVDGNMATNSLVITGSPWDYNWSSAAVNDFLCGAGFGTGTATLHVVPEMEDARCDQRNAGASVFFTASASICVASNRRPAEARPAAPAVPWVSQLDVAGGRGQVVLNASEALFPGAGRVPLVARLRSGENRVEAQLVQADGKAGLWRFEVGADRLVAGSLRVISGQVALVTGDAVAFRMKGQPGERVVFTFRSR